jgi:hypothetical protein
MKATVCGIGVPIFLPPVIEYFVLGSAMLFVATMHVKYLRAEKALPARVLLIIGLLFFVWLTYGDSSYTVTSKDLVTWMAATLFILAGLHVPLLATGPMPSRGDKLSISSFLEPSRAFKSDLAGAFCFVMLAAVLACVTFGITLHWSSTVSHMRMSPGEWPGIVKVGISALAVVAAMAAVSIFASAVVKLRRNAAVVAFLAIIMMFAGYGLVLANYNHGLSDPGNPVWQLAAFWPVTPLITTGNGWHSTMPVLWWPKETSWLLVSGIYGAITLALLHAAPKFARKYGGVEEEQY